MKRFIETAFIFLSAWLGTACMGDLNQYDECLDVETARCELRNRCDADFDLSGCVVYYQEFCRTRKIKGEYSLERVDACVSDLDELGTTDQCRRLDELGSKSEICVFDELASCRSFLCLQEPSSSSTSEDTVPVDTDTTPDGLNPN